jgi:hypothetical protein
MELNDYTHLYLTDDGRLCFMGQHYIFEILQFYLLHLFGEVLLNIFLENNFTREDWEGRIHLFYYRGEAKTNGSSDS